MNMRNPTLVSLNVRTPVLLLSHFHGSALQRWRRIELLTSWSLSRLLSYIISQDPNWIPEVQPNPQIPAQCKLYTNLEHFMLMPLLDRSWLEPALLIEHVAVDRPALLQH